MARVLVAPEASRQLDRLTAVLSLPADTRERFRHSLLPLADLPLVGNLVERPGGSRPGHSDQGRSEPGRSEPGRSEQGRWEGYRVLVGPWPWMLVLYTYDEDADVVGVVTVQDTRSSSSVRTART